MVMMRPHASSASQAHSAWCTGAAARQALSGALPLCRRQAAPHLAHERQLGVALLQLGVLLLQRRLQLALPPLGRGAPLVGGGRSRLGGRQARAHLAGHDVLWRARWQMAALAWSLSLGQGREAAAYRSACSSSRLKPAPGARRSPPSQPAPAPTSRLASSRIRRAFSACSARRSPRVSRFTTACGRGRAGGGWAGQWASVLRGGLCWAADQGRQPLTVTPSRCRRPLPPAAAAPHAAAPRTLLRMRLALATKASVPCVSCAPSSQGDTQATMEVLELPPATGGRVGGWWVGGERGAGTPGAAQTRQGPPACHGGPDRKSVV